MQGSSCLRAMARRKFLDETSYCMGSTVGSSHVDIETFYGNVDPGRLITAALTLVFPHALLSVLVFVHEAPRVLRAGQCYSEPVHITTTILAGRTSSNSLARGLLHGCCENMHIQHPRTIKEHFVNDTYIRVEGSRAAVVADLTSATLTLAPLLEESGFRVAGKSVVVASEMKVAKQVVSNLLACGRGEIQAACSARDLVVDITCGARRSARVMSKRLQTVKARTKRVLRLNKFVKGARANKLWKTGLAPAATYAGKLQGYS